MMEVTSKTVFSNTTEDRKSPMRTKDTASMVLRGAGGGGVLLPFGDGRPRKSKWGISGFVQNLLTNAPILLFDSRMVSQIAVHLFIIWNPSPHALFPPLACNCRGSVGANRQTGSIPQTPPRILPQWDPRTLRGKRSQWNQKADGIFGLWISHETPFSLPVSAETRTGS